MKAAKLLREGCRTAANLLRPRMDMIEGFETWKPSGRIQRENVM